MHDDKALTTEKKYALLSEINHRLSGTLDLDLILEELLDSVATVIAFDAGGIFVLSDDILPAGLPARRMITHIVWRGYPSNPAADDPMMTRGRGIIGHVIRTGQHIVAPDVRRNPYYVTGREPTLSEVAVPIVVGERTIGALNLESDRLGAFNESDAAMLRFFADAAALSIDKAILHRRLLERERLEDQMKLARVVQARLLPAAAPDVPGYDIAGVCVPAFDVGGDYYDFIDLPGDRLGLAIADVSGEGVPAAMIMSAFRALLRTYARSAGEPQRVAELLNQLLPEFTGQVDFVTAFYGVLDPAAGSFAYVNCGHNPPILRRADGDSAFLLPGGPLLSILDGATYESGAVQLDQGDTLLLYTDGIVELVNEGFQEYGLERLQASAFGQPAGSMHALLGGILADARDYAQSDVFSDDLTLLVVRRL